MARLMTLLAAVAVCAEAGCTPEQYAKLADRSAYGALASGQQVALGERRPFAVTYKPFLSEENGDGKRVIRIDARSIPVGEGKPTILNLGDCLLIAFRNSRNLQTAKENLYSDALALANATRTWDWSLITGNLDAEYDYTRVSGTSTDKTGTAGAELALTQRFIHGGVLALGASLDFATDFLGSNTTTLGSLLEANFTQPLLQGAWRGFAYEDQYRLERDFLFSVFDYDRFTQTFAANIVSDFYSVLQRRDQLANEEANIERLKDTLALTRVLADGGQVSRIEENQAEQDLLNAQVRLETIQENYQNSLDNFKLTLGLPITANVELPYPQALEDLRKVGPKAVNFDQEAAIATALAVRPDVLTERARVRDARKDVEIAADQFNPQLDLELDISAEGSEDRKFYRTRFHEHTRTVNVVFNYPLDQTDNRDAYRLALIAQARAEREYEEFVDQVRQDVRQAYRALLQSARSYEIQVRSVEIAVRRRRLAALQQREGLASARDVLESEEALRTAQNGLTNALVTYTTTRLDFLASLGMLHVDEQGQLNERAEPFKFTELRKRYE